MAAVELNRSSAPLWVAYAKLLVSQGNVEAAARVYHTALSLLVQTKEGDAVVDADLSLLFMNYVELEIRRGRLSRALGTLAFCVRGLRPVTFLPCRNTGWNEPG